MNRHPLSWPDGWRRTAPARRKSGNFKSNRNRISVHQAITRILEELQRFGVLEGDSIVSTNIPTRLDGLPRGDQPEPADPGVAVYWQRPGDKAPRVMAIDLYDRVADNLAAIAATLDAMRAIERHGGAIIMERAFTGFTALPSAHKPWRHVFGYQDDVDPPFDEVQLTYRRLAQQRHPDRPGGTDNLMAELNVALEEARRELCP